MLFEWKQRREIEEKKIRAKLEKAYEVEKSKVILLLDLDLLFLSVCDYEEVQQDLPRVLEKH